LDIVSNWLGGTKIGGMTVVVVTRKVLSLKGLLVPSTCSTFWYTPTGWSNRDTEAEADRVTEAAGVPTDRLTDADGVTLL